jgi:hypothetical protein
MLIRRAANEGLSQRVLGELIGLKPLTSLLRWPAAAQGITEHNLPASATCALSNTHPGFGLLACGSRCCPAMLVACAPGV